MTDHTDPIFDGPGLAGVREALRRVETCHDVEAEDAIRRAFRVLGSALAERALLALSDMPVRAREAALAHSGEAFSRISSRFPLAERHHRMIATEFDQGFWRRVAELEVSTGTGGAA